MVDARREGAVADALGAELYRLASELYPIARSITGEGLRASLRILAKVAPLTLTEVPTGTSVLDWTVPREWNIREAWIANAKGDRVVDMRDTPLHVVGYSAPVRARMTLDALRPHLHTLPEQPDRVPYRTSYYAETWGFCLSHRALDALPAGEYEVCIDATLAPGSLTYGEIVLPGARSEEILFSAHSCHPALADDNASGMAVAALLARELARTPHRWTYRFLFAPGTIGAITWLARNRDAAARVRGGLTLTCLGDSFPFTYKRSFDGDTYFDRAVARALIRAEVPHQVIDFFPYGYDERQFDSPGFRMPVGSLMRGRHGEFPEYHTSGDDLSFISPARLAQSLQVLRTIVAVLEGDRRYRGTAPFGEPQLGRRGLYRATGGPRIPDLENAMLWVLSFADGDHTLEDVAGRSGLALDTITAAAQRLAEHDLIVDVP
jgi:aminopeptidase-like protein